MKKILAAILCISMIACFSGCRSNPAQENGSSSAEAESQTSQAAIEGENTTDAAIGGDTAGEPANGEAGAESKPSDTSKPDSKPDNKPDSKPDGKPSATAPAQKPADQKPAETKPAETKPAEQAPATPAANTIGTKYLAVFNSSSKNSASAIIDELMASKVFGADMMKVDVTPGPLDGFDAEITGFTAGSKFSPMIGSIPFVCYVFESDNPSALESTLKANANPAWNVCTEADETVSKVKGKFVFFIMCSNE